MRSIPFFLLLLMLPMAMATIYDGLGEGLTSLYSDAIPSGNSIELEGQLYVVTVTGTKASLMRDDGFRLVANLDDCETEGALALCVDAISTNSNTGKREVTPRIYKIFPYYYLSQNISRDTEDVNEPLFMGESVQVQLLLTNIGQADAKEARMTLSYPDFFQVDSVTSPCELTGDEIIFVGELEQTEDVLCYYEITPQTEAVYNQVAHVTSTVEGTDEEFSQQVAGTTFTIEDFVETTLAFNESTAEIGQEMTYSITLRNRFDSTIDLESLDIQLSPHVEVDTLPIGAIRRAGNRISFPQFSIGQNANFTTDIELFATSAGTIEPQLFGTYTAGGIQRELFARGTSLTIDDWDEAVLTVDVDSAYDGLQEGAMSVWVQNTNKYMALENLRLRVYTNLTFSSGASMAILEPNRKRKILGLTFRAPDVTLDTKFPLDFNLTYDTQFEEGSSEILETDVTVESLDGIDITHTFTPTSLTKGNWSKLVVDVQNDRKDNLQNVRMETTSTTFDIIGRVSLLADLDASEKITAYTNHITYDRGESDTGDVTTRVWFEQNGKKYAYTETATVTIVQENVSDEKYIPYGFSLTRDLSPSPDRIGSSSFVSYTLENEGTYELEEISVSLPKQEEWDIIGNESIYINRLLPGEVITIPDIAKVVPKFVGGQILREDKVSFVREGSLVQNISKNTSHTISTKRVQQVLVVRRSIGFIEGNRARINLSVQNIGSNAAEYTLSDTLYDTSNTIGPGETQYYQHEREFTKGNHVLAPATVSYDVAGESQRAFSNKTTFIINTTQVPPPQPVSTPAPVPKKDPKPVDTETPPPVQELTEDIGRDVPAEEEQSESGIGSFFSNILSKIKGWFS